MIKILVSFIFMTSLIVFTGCTAAEEEGADKNLTNVSPVIADFETTIEDDIENGESVGTVELIAGDLNQTTFTIFSSIYDENGTEIEDIAIQDYLLNKERLLPPTEFQIDDNGVISVKAASLIDYVQAKSYSFYVVAENDFGTSQLGTVSIDVTKAGRIEIVAASYLNIPSYLSAENDYLWVYFDRPYDINTIPSDLSNAFKITGEGKIGSNSKALDEYALLGPLNYIPIELNSTGTESLPFVVGSDSISKTAIGFYDVNGQPSALNSPSIVIDKYDLTARVQSGSNVCLKIETVDEESSASDINCSSTDAIKSEFDISKLADRNLSALGDIVKDFGTYLEWQKDDVNISRTFSEATNYCNALTLNSQSDWRVPTMKELETIVDRSKSGLKFKNKFGWWNQKYWSSDKFAIADTNSSAWYMDFENLINGIDLQSEDFYVRCVREIKE